MFLIFAGILALLATVFVLYPFVRQDLRTADHNDHIVAILQEQLDELDRDRSRGLLTEKQVAVSRAEIERRLEGIGGPSERPGTGGAILRALVAASITVGLTAGTFTIYLYLGMPEQFDQPLAQRTEALQVAQHRRQLDEFSRTLASRLQATPDDAEGWAMLGRLHRAFGRFPESAEAFGRAHALRPGAATVAADHAEALVHVAQGIVSRTAEDMFAEALAKDPKNVTARFYMGAALASRPGDIPEAIEMWSELEREAPPDAPWLDILRQNIRQARAELAALAEPKGSMNSSAGAVRPAAEK